MAVKHLDHCRCVACGALAKALAMGWVRRQGDEYHLTPLGYAQGQRDKASHVDRRMKQLRVKEQGK